MSTDQDLRVTADDAVDLRDAECSSCLGMRMIHDAESGESHPCSRCASPVTSEANVEGAEVETCAPSGRITAEVEVQTPEAVRESILVELDAARDPVDGRRLSMPSPMASLSGWARDYLDAERTFRHAQAELVGDGRARSSVGYVEALRRVALAEIVLRQAVGSPEALDIASLECERTAPLEVMAALPGVGIATHPSLFDALTSIGIRHLVVYPALESADRAESVVLVRDAPTHPRELGLARRMWSALLRALTRLRDGWEDRSRGR